MTKQELLAMSLESEEKGFANIRSLQASWNQYGVVLPVLEQAIQDKDLERIRVAVEACIQQRPEGDLKMVPPGSDISRKLMDVLRNLKIIYNIRALKGKVLELADKGVLQ